MGILIGDKNMNKYAFVLFAAIFLVGTVFAASNVTALDHVYEGRYQEPTSTQSDVTEAGNVTTMNISANVSTMKWAGYYGNVSGTIVLSNSSYAVRMYSWNWNGGSGEVCISTDNSPTWSSLQDTTAGTVDTVWSFTTTDADSATNTYSGTTAWNIAGQSGNAPSVTLINPNIATYVVADSAAPASTNDLLFCSNINSNSQYAIMAPAATGGSTTTYYFYVELS